MRILYFDTFSGASGDMIAGALLGLGAKPNAIKRQLAALKLPEKYTVSLKPVTRSGIAALKFSVTQKTASPKRRTYKEIQRLITNAKLPLKPKSLALEIFHCLAEAEGRVHGVAPEQVHFHELGALDSIIDIVTIALAFDALKAECAYSSPLVLGAGTVETEHGSMPLPAPATAELIRGIPAKQIRGRGELLTPTGAAVLKTLCKNFGPIPPMTISAIGYGAGTKNPPDTPNALRVFLGETEIPDIAQQGAREKMFMVETNIDDMTPELSGYLQERLFASGALDVFVTNVIMKKNRPGLLVSALCRESELAAIRETIFAETPTFGLRFYPVEREHLERRFENICTEFGVVKVKLGIRDGRIITAAPEYEDCRTLALKKKIPLRRIFDATQILCNKIISKQNNKKRSKK